MDDLVSSLKRAMSDPEIVQAMQDIMSKPKCLKALQEISRGNEETIAKYANDAEVMDALAKLSTTLSAFGVQ